MTDRRKPKPHSNQLVDTLPASSSIGPPPEPTRSECRRSTRIHSHTDKTLVPGPSSMGPPPLPTQPRRSTRIASRPVNEHSDDNEAAISSQGSSSKRGGSGHKRRQSEMEASSEVPSSSSRATGFSASTKNKVELEAGALVCWHCGAISSLEIAHVIAGRERELFFQLKAVNRLSIEHIHHKDNGIQLCVACHRNFDNSYPAWVFIPTDIQFFINFETSDWTRRSNSARPGLPFPPRLCPSVAQYSQRGGLYDSYIERNYFFRNVVTEHLLMPGRSGLQPASTRWHGDPMAALNRGFKMVGIAPDIFPDAVRNALTSLNLLYRTHDNSQPLTAASSIFRRPGPGAYGPGDSNDDGGNVGNLRAPPPPHPTPKGRQAAKPGQAGSSRPSHKGKKRPVDQYADRRRSARIQDRFFRKHFGRSKEEQDRARRLLEDPPAEELILRREITDGIWKWGPMSSSNEAMMAPKKTSEQKTHIGTKKARLSQGLLSPSTGGRV